MAAVYASWSGTLYARNDDTFGYTTGQTRKCLETSGAVLVLCLLEGSAAVFCVLSLRVLFQSNVHDIFLFFSPSDGNKGLQHLHFPYVLMIKCIT